MTKLCVILLFCSCLKTLAAATVFSYNDEITHISAGTADLIDDQQLTVKGTIKDAATGDPLPSGTGYTTALTNGRTSPIGQDRKSR